MKEIVWDLKGQSSRYCTKEPFSITVVVQPRLAIISQGRIVLPDQTRFSLEIAPCYAHQCVASFTICIWG